MPDAPRVGLLPLYLKLYDDVQPEARPEMEAFADRVAETLRGTGLDVLRGPRVCAAVGAPSAGSWSAIPTCWRRCIWPTHRHWRRWTPTPQIGAAAVSPQAGLRRGCRRR